MPKLRIAVILLLLVTVAVTLFLLLTPSPAPPEPRPTEAAGLVLRGYEEGRLAWEATAEEGEIASETGTLSRVALRAFDQDDVTLDVTADALKQEGDALTLTGNVRGETADGIALSSDAMTWRTDERRLESGWTLLNWGEDELASEAFVYDARREQATLTGVRATLRRNETFVLTSERGEVSRDRVFFAGTVEIASNDQTLGADELETDSDGDVVTLRGNVAASGPQIELRADSLVLAPDGQTARGNVSVDVIVAAEEGERGT